MCSPRNWPCLERSTRGGGLFIRRRYRCHRSDGLRSGGLAGLGRRAVARHRVRRLPTPAKRPHASHRRSGRNTRRIPPALRRRELRSSSGTTRRSTAAMTAESVHGERGAVAAAPPRRRGSAGHGVAGSYPRPRRHRHSNPHAVDQLTPCCRCCSTSSPPSPGHLPLSWRRRGRSRAVTGESGIVTAAGRPVRVPGPLRGKCWIDLALGARG